MNTTLEYARIREPAHLEGRVPRMGGAEHGEATYAGPY